MAEKKVTGADIEAASVIISEDSGVVKKFSSGSVMLDCIAGGGIPWGKMINIVGDNSSGKTLIACEIIANAVKQFGDKVKWRYNDSEGGFSFSTQDMYGIEIVDNEKYPPSTTIEEFDLDLHKHLEALKPGEKLIYVLDSLDALGSMDEQDAVIAARKKVAKGGAADGSYNLSKQKKLNQLFRSQIVEMNGKEAVLILISQVRENIGVMFGKKYKRNGGKSLDFYAALIFWLAEVEKKTKLDRPVGVTIKVKNEKNKVGLPFRTGYLDILFDYGLDDLTSCAYYLCDARTDTGKTVKGKSASYQYAGQNFGSIEEMVEYVEKNNLEAQLKKDARAKWRDVELSIRSQRKRRF